MSVCTAMCICACLNEYILCRSYAFIKTVKANEIKSIFREKKGENHCNIKNKKTRKTSSYTKLFRDDVANKNERKRSANPEDDQDKKID